MRGGSRGVVGYDEEKGVLCHTEQILELYIVNFRLLNFTLRRKGLPLKGDENCLFRALGFYFYGTEVMQVVRHKHCLIMLLPTATDSKALCAMQSE